MPLENLKSSVNKSNTISYPNHLLPQANYCYINQDLSDKYLVRHTNSKDFIDVQTNKLLAKHLCSPAERLEDLSTNLLSDFSIQDIQIELINEDGNKDYFQEYWNEGIVIDKLPIHEKDFKLNENRGYFFLPINQINGKPQPYTVSGIDGFFATCKVVHTPTNTNFWHFSLRWFDKEGRDLREVSRNLKNRLFTSARAMVLELAEYEQIPDYQPLPKSFYTK
jgi:hypothetical protein